MSDQPGRENIEDDLGSYSVDDENQLPDEDTLQDASEPSDEVYTPPDRRPIATEWGTTASEQAQGESLEQRLRQEEPDPSSAYGAPHHESGLDPEPRSGGDDPDSIPVQDDYLGDAEVGDAAAGGLVASDEGVRADHDAELDASEAGAGNGPEDGAMHIVQDS